MTSKNSVFGHFSTDTFEKKIQLQIILRKKHERPLQVLEKFSLQRKHLSPMSLIERLI